MSMEQEMRRVSAASSFYGILGVDRGASPREVKAAYCRLSLLLHPDRSGDVASMPAFQRVALAYEWLSDEDKRRQYDVLLFGQGTDPQQAELAKQVAAALAAMALFGSDAQNRCAYPGCSAPIQDSCRYCDKCQRKQEPRCIQCGSRVSTAGKLCENCSSRTMGKQGRCTKFGCLFPLETLEDFQCGICRRCRNKPKKCAEFGCLRKVVGPSGFCDVHRVK